MVFVGFPINGLYIFYRLEPQGPSLWIGTSQGSVFGFKFSVPDEACRFIEQIVLSPVMLFRMKGPVSAIALLNREFALLAGPYSRSSKKQAACITENKGNNM